MKDANCSRFRLLAYFNDELKQNHRIMTKIVQMEKLRYFLSIRSPSLQHSKIKQVNVGAY